jgi:SAM-dependent methyltransferase
MELNSYKATWNNRVNSLKTGAIAVDGSTDEETLISNGKWTAKQMLTALDISKEDVVLEMGCGVARIGKLLAPHCKKWIGTDIADNMIDVAKERLKEFDNVEFHALARNDLSCIADNSVDKVYTVAVFCHLDKEDLYNYLKEMHRILKPGGVVYAETWNLASAIGWERWELEAKNWFISDHSQRKDVGRNQFCSPDEFTMYVQHAGFNICGNYSDSVWNQIIAIKGDDETQTTELTNYLAKNEEDFIYSKIFSECYKYSMRVTHNAIHPREMIVYLDTIKDMPEEVLFRRFVIGMWKNNENLWGEVDV